jgi:hypothetical protein
MNTDDCNPSNSAWRDRSASRFTVADIRNQARQTGVSRPPLQDDSSTVACRRHRMAAHTAARFVHRHTAAGSARRAGASGRPGRILPRDPNLPAVPEQQPELARDTTEMAMLADITADTIRRRSRSSIGCGRISPAKPTSCSRRPDAAGARRRGAAVEAALTCLN